MKRWSISRSAVVGLCLTAVLSLLLVLWAWWYASVPIVFESWTRQQCVKVDDPSGRYSCHELPTRYVHVWVE